RPKPPGTHRIFLVYSRYKCLRQWGPSHWNRPAVLSHSPNGDAWDKHWILNSADIPKSAFEKLKLMAMINITYKITNKLISRFALATLLVAGPGCDDLLTEKPRTFLAQDVVFQTVDGAVSATTGIYKPLGGTDLYGWWLLGCMELFSDYINDRGSQAPLGDYQLDATSIQRIGFIWRGAYQIINRANIVIDRLEHQTIPGM